VRGLARLDGRDELLLAIAEGRPVHLDLDVLVLRPRLDLLGDHVVARGDEALEEPEPQLGLGLRRRHAAQRVQSRRGAAGDDRRLAKELAARDETCAELLGQMLEAVVHRRLLLGSAWSRGGGGRTITQRRAAGKQTLRRE